MDEMASTAEFEPRATTSALEKRKELLSHLPPPIINSNKDGDIDLAEPTDFQAPSLLGNIIQRRRSEKLHVSHNHHKYSGFLNLKKEFEAKFSERRKIGQAQRADQYRNENEGLFEEEEAIESDEDEEKEDEEAKKARREEIIKKATAEDIEDEDDSDYQGDEESEQSDGEEEEEEAILSGEDTEVSVDEINKSFFIDQGKESISGSQHLKPIISPPMNAETLDDDSAPKSANDIDAPATFSQWFRDESPPIEDSTPLTGFSNLESTVSQPIDEDELLALCSGRFVETQLNEAPQMDVEDDGDVQPIKRTQRTNKGLDSDDEDEPASPKEKLDELAKDVAQEETTDSNDVNLLTTEKPDSLPSENGLIRRRAVLAEDLEEEDDKIKPVISDYDEESGVEEQEEKVEEPESDIDSDDELAVFRRDEHKRKLKQDGFFDEQAELSGSDVGSDDENEEDGNDEYEKDVADDEAIDMDEIADQNHKLFMKQQNDADKREMRHLQEKLLADGDLAGPETNRLFRFAIRDDGDMGLQMDEEPTAADDDDQDEALELMARQRADVIKFQLEQGGREAFNDTDGDAISSAFRSVQAAVSQKAPKTQRQSISLLDLKLNVPTRENNPMLTKAMYTSTKQDQAMKRPAISEDSLVKKPKLVLDDVLNQMD